MDNQAYQHTLADLRFAAESGRNDVVIVFRNRQGTATGKVVFGETLVDRPRLEEPSDLKNNNDKRSFSHHIKVEDILYVTVPAGTRRGKDGNGNDIKDV